MLIKVKQRVCFRRCVSLPSLHLACHYVDCHLVLANKACLLYLLKQPSFVVYHDPEHHNFPTRNLEYNPNLNQPPQFSSTYNTIYKMQTKSIVLAAMALISATTASSVKWCNEYNQKGDCDTVDASTFCTAIPDSNAKGDTGSSAQVSHHPPNETEFV